MTEPIPKKLSVFERAARSKALMAALRAEDWARARQALEVAGDSAWAAQSLMGDSPLRLALELALRDKTAPIEWIGEASRAARIEPQEQKRIEAELIEAIESAPSEAMAIQALRLGVELIQADQELSFEKLAKAWKRKADEEGWGGASLEAVARRALERSEESPEMFQRVWEQPAAGALIGSLPKPIKESVAEGLVKAGACFALAPFEWGAISAGQKAIERLDPIEALALLASEKFNDAQWADWVEFDPGWSQAIRERAEKKGWTQKSEVHESIQWAMRLREGREALGSAAEESHQVWRQVAARAAEAAMRLPQELRERLADELVERERRALLGQQDPSVESLSALWSSLDEEVILEQLEEMVASASEEQLDQIGALAASRLHQIATRRGAAVNERSMSAMRPTRVAAQLLWAARGSMRGLESFLRTLKEKLEGDEQALASWSGLPGGALSSSRERFGSPGAPGAAAALRRVFPSEATPWVWPSRAGSATRQSWREKIWEAALDEWERAEPKDRQAALDGKPQSPAARRLALWREDLAELTRAAIEACDEQDAIPIDDESMLKEPMGLAARVWAEQAPEQAARWMLHRLTSKEKDKSEIKKAESLIKLIGGEAASRMAKAAPAALQNWGVRDLARSEPTQWIRAFARLTLGDELEPERGWSRQEQMCATMMIEVGWRIAKDMGTIGSGASRQWRAPVALMELAEAMPEAARAAEWSEPKKGWAGKALWAALAAEALGRGGWLSLGAQGWSEQWEGIPWDLSDPWARSAAAAMFNELSLEHQTARMVESVIPGLLEWLDQSGVGGCDPAPEGFSALEMACLPRSGEDSDDWPSAKSSDKKLIELLAKKEGSDPCRESAPRGETALARLLRLERQAAPTALIGALKKSERFKPGAGLELARLALGPMRISDKLGEELKAKAVERADPTAVARALKAMDQNAARRRRSISQIEGLDNEAIGAALVKAGEPALIEAARQDVKIESLKSALETLAASGWSGPSPSLAKAAQERLIREMESLEERAIGVWGGEQAQQELDELERLGADGSRMPAPKDQSEARSWHLAERALQGAIESEAVSKAARAIEWARKKGWDQTGMRKSVAEWIDRMEPSDKESAMAGDLRQDFALLEAICIEQGAKGEARAARSKARL